MVRRTIAALSCLGLAAAGQFPQGSCDDSSPKSNTCCDTTPENNDKCVKHVKWAMEYGAPKHPDWYDIYDVRQGDTYANFQCALFMISMHKEQQAEEAGFPAEQHGCPRPCTATVEHGCDHRPPVAAPAAPSFKKASCPAKVTPTGCECGSVLQQVADCEQEVCNPSCPSLEAWQIALIVILVLALLAGLAYVMCMPQEKAKKKKRAIKKTPAPAAPAPVEPAPLPVQPLSYTMQPVQSFTMVQQPPPVHVVTTAHAAPITYAAPPPQPVQMVQQQPMMPMPQPVQTMVQTYAAPVPMPQPVQTMVQTYAAPVATAQPVQTMVQTYAAPMATAQPVQYVQQPVNMFDALDTNGDGVITRAEMAAMGQFQQPQVMQYR